MSLRRASGELREGLVEDLQWQGGEIGVDHLEWML